MKKFGLIVLAVGLIGIYLTLGMDTSVPSSGGHRVHNIGLMSEKQNFLIISIAVAIAGLITSVFGGRNRKLAPSSKTQTSIDTNQATRACPFCAERIMAQAIVCRYCGRDIAPVAISSDALTLELSNRAEENSGMSDYLSRLESSLKTTFVQIGKSKVVTSFIAIRIDNYLNIIALLLLVYGLAVVVYFGFIDDYSAWGEHADRIRFNTLRDVTPIFFAGLFLILRKALGKPFNPEHESAKNARSTLHSKTSWMFFGEAIDLILIQSALILMLVVMHRDGLLTIAYVLALLVVVVGYLLARFGSYIFGYATIACGALYLFYRHVWFSDLMFSIESLTRTLEGPTLISVTPYMWLMIASVAVPHLRLIRLGSMQYGKLRGDISFTIAKHEIFLPLVSALVFSVLWFGVLAAVRDGYYWTIGRMF